MLTSRDGVLKAICAYQRKGSVRLTGKQGQGLQQKNGIRIRRRFRFLKTFLFFIISRPLACNLTGAALPWQRVGEAPVAIVSSLCPLCHPLLWKWSLNCRCSLSQRPRFRRSRALAHHDLSNLGV
jgi:hypothetical protein